MDLEYADRTLLEMARKAGVTIAPGAFPADRTVEANGLELHYLDWGSEGSPVILFLHGGAQNAHMWDFAALALRDRWRCIALDQRGHGDSQWASDGDYALSAHQRDIQEFVKALRLTRFVLVGLSLGGRNAYVYTAEHPEQVKALVVVDIGPESGEEGLREIRQFVELPDELDSFEEFVQRVAKYSPLRPLEQVKGSLKHHVKQLPNGKWTWKYDKVLRDPERLRERTPAEYLWSCVQKIRCPTLIVRGGQSKVFLEATAQRMAQLIPGSKLVTVERAGHRVPGDAPAAFEGALIAFLASLPGLRPPRAT